jgi:hypothetical protein
MTMFGGADYTFARAKFKVVVETSQRARFQRDLERLHSIRNHTRGQRVAARREVGIESPGATFSCAPYAPALFIAPRSPLPVHINNGAYNRLVRICTAAIAIPA